MTNPNRTAVCLCVDRSGSTQLNRKVTQDTIDEYVKAQAAAPGQVTVRIVQFDAPGKWTGQGEDPWDWYLVHCPSTPAKDVPPFILQPRGMTALYDAVVITVDEFSAELGALPEDERPGTVVLAILTDGEENASERYNSLDVKARIEHQIDAYQWHVVHLGANQDAILEGAKMGIPQASSITYDATEDGVAAAGEALRAYTVTASAGGPAEFTDEDRKRASKSATSTGKSVRRPR
jgi:hypothetical protein